MPPRTQQSRSVLLETITLTDNLTTTRKLSASGAWLKLRFRLSATTSGGTPSGLSRYEGFGVMNRIRLRAGGRPVFDLIPGEVYKRQMFHNGTRPERVAASTTPGAWSYSFEVPFVLPRPFSYPRSGITAFPAAILPNIELEVAAASSMMGGLYGTVSTTAFTAGPTLTVTAEIMDISDAQLRAMVAANHLHGFLQQQLTDLPTSTGTRDVQLVAGEGVMTGLFLTHADATALAFDDAMVTDQQVIAGSNDFVTQTQFHELQNRGREQFGVPDPVIYTGLNTTGAAYITYAPNGALGEGIDLNGLQSLKLRSNIATLTNNNGATNIIQEILLPGYWRTVASA